MSAKHLNQDIKVSGWIQIIRKLGAMTFIDLRDETGLVQVVSHHDHYDLTSIYHQLTPESFIEVTGQLIQRKRPNSNLKTGLWEIKVHQLYVINHAQGLPFLIKDKLNEPENLRLKYRYLDLRRPIMQNNLRIRHQVFLTIRNFLSNQDFIEVETPLLSRSTREGAKSFVVLTDTKSKHYVLPQSPQMFKQLLMNSGVGRYFQIARCFRNEPCRSDRQLEFTQLDIEITNPDFTEIKQITENLMIAVYKTINKTLDFDNFKILSYRTAIEKYGSDKPDLRFKNYLQDVTSVFKRIDIGLWKLIQTKTEFNIQALFIKQTIQNKKLEFLKTVAKQNNVVLLTIKQTDQQTLSGSLTKLITSEKLADLQNIFQSHNKPGTYLMIGAVGLQAKIALGAVRYAMGQTLSLTVDQPDQFVWIVNWPLLEYDEKNNKYTYMHHPFTLPQNKYISDIKTSYPHALSEAYDLVLNGVEIGGGSLRIHKKDLQIKILKILGLNDQQIKDYFMWFLNAFDFGMPPHGGIAFGLDRLLMVMLNETTIRNVIAFPKNNSGLDLLTGAPVDLQEDL